jgi:hypothetical protein
MFIINKNSTAHGVLSKLTRQRTVVRKIVQTGRAKG